MQARILLQDLVGLVAVADPELVLDLLLPGAAPPSSRTPRGAGRSCGRRRPGRPRTMPLAPLSKRISTEARSSTLMSTSSTLSSAPAAANASREPSGFLRCLITVVMSAEHLDDAQAADVLGQVAPVRADVAERRRRAALLRLEAPRVVGVLEQPVLQVLAVHERRRADVAAGDGEPRLLDERVAAVVEGDGVDDAGLDGEVAQRLRLGRGHRQRLVRDDVLALGDRRGVDRIVQRVGRAVVDDLRRRGRRAAPRSCRRPSGCRARPPSSAPTPRCCRPPPRRRRSRAAAPRPHDADR